MMHENDTLSDPVRMRGDRPGIGRWFGHARGRARISASFVGYALRRFVQDGCLAASGALSYTTLVSLVPLAAIGLGTLSVFPIFAQVREQLLGHLFQDFVPEIGEDAAWWFRYFAGSAAQTTALGVAGIAATGILLLVTIEDQLNLIWRVTAARPWVQRVLAYWTVMTLGPILLGISLSLSTYFEIIARSAGFEERALALFSHSWAHVFSRGVPMFLELVAYGLLYCVIPNCAVRWRDGLIGAVVATIATELLKVGFSLYITEVSSYRTVYGTLAAIPIFLLWMYLLWMVVLFGAIVASALPNWTVDRQIGRISPGGLRIGFSLALLASLSRAQKSGTLSGTPGLAAALGVSTTVIDEHMKPLVEGGFVAHTQEGCWVLAWEPRSATLHDLYRALGLPLAGSWLQGPLSPWQRLVAPAMDRVIGSETAMAKVPLSELLDRVGEPAGQIGAPARA